MISANKKSKQNIENETSQGCLQPQASFCLPEHKRWHFLSFKVPFGPVLPIVGIAGIIYMILNISTDPVKRNMIWLVTGITFAILAVYSFFWIKFKMKMSVFKSVPLEKVMAMENSMYYKIRKRRGIWR